MTDDDENREETGGILGGLRDFFEALADAERDGKSTTSRVGRSGKGRFSAEYGFSGRIKRPSSGGRSGDESDDIDADRTDHDEYLVDARYDEDDRLLVVADLPGVDAEELTVGLDEERNELVVGVEDRAVERLELPWPTADVEGQFHHGVLELRVTPEEGTE